VTAARKRLAEHVRVPLSAERTDRMWRRLDAELGKKRGPSRAVVVAAAMAAAAAVAMVAVGARNRAVTPPPISRDDARPKDEGITLPDGSRLTPGPDAKTTVLVASPAAIRVRLDRGAATLDVVSEPRRTFVLEAGPAEVHADSAHFRAEFAGEPPVLSLAVDSGSVVVRSPDGAALASLQAGQSWTLRSAPPEPSSLPPARVRTPPRPAPPPSTSARAPELETPPTAQALFGRADEARLAGDPARAAQSLEQLCTLYPGDARAGVAAFQLARLRLNELGDPAAAARWFRVALAHPSAGTYREDAAADLVEALDRAGNVAECRAARDVFSVAHPASRRLAAVSKRCVPR
jgi:transmembrane sensor